MRDIDTDMMKEEMRVKRRHASLAHYLVYITREKK